jgi:hypothetical protein
MSVTDAERADRPTSTAQNRKAPTKETAKQLNISTSSANSVVRDKLQFHRVCARWVTYELTEEHKRMRLDICSRHVARYSEHDSSLQRNVTGDETRVHQYQPPDIKRKTQSSRSQLLLTIFWDSQRPLFGDLPGT